MGHYAAIILIGAFTIGGLLILTMQRTTGDADRALSEHQYEFLAREAAHTGLNMALRTLADSYAMQSWNYGTNHTLLSNVAYKTGRYTVTVTTNNPSGAGLTGDTVDVTARGFSGTGEHVIFARYARDKDDKGIPPAFKNAITSDHYMQYMGNMLVASIDATRNASIHTNQDLVLKGNSFRVEGFGTYSGSVTISAAAENNFVPADDMGYDPPYHYQAPMIDIPAIDSVRLKSLAQSGQGIYINMGGWASTTPITIDGDALPLLDFTQPIDFGGGRVYTPCTGCATPEKPAVLYVDGPLDVLNRVAVHGNVVVISTGDTSIKPVGHGGGFFGQLDANQETKMLLASLKGIVIGEGGGNACMGLGPATMGGASKINQHCQSGGSPPYAPSGADGSDGYTYGVTVYAEERVEMLGTPVIVGGVVADETYMNNGGNPSVIYASANEGTLDAGFEYIVPIGPILIAFSEF